MTRWRDRAALEAWQEGRVTAHLKKVLPRSPWLQRRFAGRSVHEWRSVPVTGKAEAMSQFKDWNTAGISWQEAMAVALRAEESRDFSPQIRGVTVGLSSGTSGGRGIFLASAAERAAWAGTVLGKILPQSHDCVREGQGCWADFMPAPHRVALFLRAGGGLYEAAGRGRVQFRWFDLMQPPASHWRALESFSPTVLVAPPSLLRHLAESGVAVKPERVVSCAETLDALDRRRLELHFGSPLHEVYQATEGFMAATDQSGILRLNEDGMVVEREWQDKDRTRFVPVITDFRRVTQPMIRHRLEDILVLKDEANAPVFTALSEIAGRIEDRLWAVGPEGKTPVFGDLVVRAMLRAADLEDFRVWQVAADRLEVGLWPEAGAPQRQMVTVALQDLWETMGGKIAIQWRSIPENEAPGVKRRRIRQSWQEGQG